MFGLICVVALAAAGGATDPQAVSEVVVTGQPTQGYRAVDTSALDIDLSIRDLPATVNVITDQFLKDIGARKLADIIAYTPGVVNNETAGTTAEEFIVRGFQTSFTYINGVRQTYYDQRRSVATIDRVEIVKGPAGVEGGGVADPGGTVNILTKQPKGAFGAELSLGGGDYGYRDARADVTGPLALGGKLQGRLVADYQEDPHYRPGIRDRMPFGTFAPSLRWEYAPGGAVYVQYEYIDSNAYYDRGVLHLPGAFPGDGFAPRDSFSIHSKLNYSHTQSSRVEIGWDQKLNSVLTARARVQDVDVSQYGASLDAEPSAGDLYAADGYTWNGVGHTLPMFYSEGPNPSHYRTFQGSLQADFGLWGANHTVVGGYEHADNMQEDRYFNRDVSNTLDIFAPDNDQKPVFTGDPVTIFFKGREIIDSGYGQWVARWTPRFRTVAGVRVDDYSLANADTFADPTGTPTLSGLSDTLVSYRLAASYDVTKAATAFFCYSNGFQPQSGFTRTGPVPALKAESVEGGVKIALFGGAALWTNTLYQIEQQNLTIGDPTNLPFENFVVLFGSVRVRGFESEITGKPIPELELGAGLSVLESEVTQNADGLEGKRFVNVPDVQASLFASYNLAKLRADRWTVRLGLNVIGDRAGDAENRYDLPSYVRVDAGLAYKINPKLTLDLHVENLLDETYYSAADQGGYGGGTISVGNRRLASAVLSYKY